MKSESRPAKDSTCPPEQVALPAIIHEDNHIIVVIKPDNLLTQPVPNTDEASLFAQIQSYTKGYVAAVHRLDKCTGGVMVFAKSSKAAARLSEQIRDGKFTKRYLAVVDGIPKKDSATLVHYLLKSDIRKRVEIVPMATTGAKRAELSYRVLKKIDTKIPGGMALVEVDLVTGRTHQIRVQMAGMGNPIVGDKKYNQRVNVRVREATGSSGTLGGIGLWAHELKFAHPTTGDSMRFVVNPPEGRPWTEFDFQRIKPGSRDAKGGRE